MSALGGSGGRPLLAAHDVLLLDLDGVVYAGDAAIPGAVPVLVEAATRGVRLAYVTNNASRSARDVAAHLESLGVPATEADVVTSADAAADHLATFLPTGARVLVVGASSLAEAVAARGLRPVAHADDGPVAVVQGFGPAVGWGILAEAAYVLAAGAPWVATNRDSTVPTDRGVAPGNGAFVLALELATGRSPTTIGKPEPGLFHAAVTRSGARHPLVVGDRLDTDISGARRAGLPSLVVLTGVTSVADLLSAPPDQRPDHVAADMTGLLTVHRRVKQVDAASGPVWQAGGWRASIDGDRLVVTSDDDPRDGEPRDGGPSDGDPSDGLRVAAAASWAATDSGRPVAVLGAVDLLVGRLPRRR